MKIQTIHTVYFSGTGTTKKVVSALAQTMAQALSVPVEEHCFNLPKAREQELAFGPADLVIAGVPVYAGRVPNLLLPYIKEKVKGDHTPAVAVVLYGNRNYDDGLMELRNVLTDNGFLPFAAGAFVGEHSFSTILGAGRPDGDDMALVDQLAKGALEKLAGEELGQIPVAVNGCDPIRPYYTPRDRHGEPIKDFLKAKPVTDPDKCVRCGLCARICPMGSIDPSDVSQVTGKCIKCCACVKGCPKGAKYFDHEGYLYHQHELEDQYAGRRAPSKIFL